MDPVITGRFLYVSIRVEIMYGKLCINEYNACIVGIYGRKEFVDVITFCYQVECKMLKYIFQKFPKNRAYIYDQINAI